MSRRERPASNVSPLPGQDQDVAHVEALLERLLVTSVEADATWSVVRERMGFDQDVAPLRTRHRPRRALALAIAAALMLSGVALAALANQGQATGHPRTSTDHDPQGVSGTAFRPETGSERPTPTPAPNHVGEFPTPIPSASPDTSGQTPSAGDVPGSDQHQGQDQQGGQDQQSSVQPSGQDQQQDQPDPTDGGDVQSATSASTDSNQEPSPSAQATTDQQS
ncbi:MAG TPA: hypothetical protein VF968_06210 [Actinomycetota bacterium]